MTAVSTRQGNRLLTAWQPPQRRRETWIQDLANGNTHKATIEEQRELTVSADATVVPDLDLSGQIFTKKEIEEQKIYSYNVSPDRKKVAYWRILDDASQSQFRTYPLLVKLTDGGSPVTLTTWPYYPASIGGVRTASESTSRKTTAITLTIRTRRESWRQRRPAATRDRFWTPPTFSANTQLTNPGACWHASVRTAPHRPKWLSPIFLPAKFAHL